MNLPSKLGDKDVLSGLAFIALAVMFGMMSTWLSMGTIASMGPGFLPLALAVLLGGFGLVILGNGLLRSREGTLAIAPRAMIAVAAALLIFAFCIRGAGLGPTVFAMVLIASMGSRKTRPASALVLAAGLTLFCWVAFIVILRLPISLLGPWLGGF